MKKSGWELSEEPETRPSWPDSRVRIMGVLNVTPDSFSDGGQFIEPERAVSQAAQMVAAGADIVDVGGESTRPGSSFVSTEDELSRVLPVLDKIRPSDKLRVSIDTRKSVVARAALERGVSILNDISALRHDPEMVGLAVEKDCEVILMHMRGTPETMNAKPRYTDVVGEIRAFLETRCEFAVREGIKPERIWIDPGIGFGKAPEHNLEILRNLNRFCELGFPVMVGPSRKSFIGHTLGLPVEERDEATAAACVVAVMQGARMVRVHDVKAVAGGIRMAEAISKGIEWNPIQNEVPPVEMRC